MKNYKDIGTCFRYVDGKRIFRSKFKNSKDAKEYLFMLKQLEVIDSSSITYKCPECKKWHVGME